MMHGDNKSNAGSTRNASSIDNVSSTSNAGSIDNMSSTSNASIISNAGSTRRASRINNASDTRNASYKSSDVPESMSGKSIMIQGFDYETTERIIDALTKGLTEYTSIYVNVGVQGEDNLSCHLKIGDGICCPYIFQGMADMLYARTIEDARSYLSWVKENGAIHIEGTGTILKSKFR